MPQVTKTVNQLITNSLFLLGELGVGELADAFMLSSGLEILNEQLTKFAADSIYVPFLTEVSFNFVAQKPTYSISDIIPADVNANRIIDLSYANYTVNSSGQGIIYPLQIINKAQYFGVTRLLPLNTRPGFIFLDKQALESFITVYPAPDQPYPCLLGVKSMIDSLIANQSLAELPPFYYGFLKYSLAREFRSYYPSGNWNETAEETYQDYMSTIKNSNETDVTVRPSAILSRPEPFYWQNILAY
jgi:hypothetical protein